MIGSVSYTAGVISAFIDMPHSDLTIEINDEHIFSGKYLLTVIANGTYYGGGYKASPFSSLTDGRLNLVLVKLVSRREFITLIGKYKKGTVHKTRKGKKLITYLDFERARIVSKEETSVCVDGEIIKAKELFLKVVPGGMNFSLPEKNEP